MDNIAIDLVEKYILNHLDKSDAIPDLKYIQCGNVKFCRTGNTCYLAHFQMECIMNLHITEIRNSGT